MSAEPNTAPAMQDIDDPKSMIAAAFRRFTPLTGERDPDGRWVHEYQDISTFGRKHVQGAVDVRQTAGGTLRIVSSRNCPDGYRYWTIAELERRNDAWRTPSAWTVESKVAKRSDAPAYLQSRLTKHARVRDGVLTLQEGGHERRELLPGAYACKWGLLDSVGRLSMSEGEELAFTLIDEYDELCPKQRIRFRGRSEVETRKGAIEVALYQHTGTATMPGVYYVDNAGRVLFYVAGMQMLALARADGHETGA